MRILNLSFLVQDQLLKVILLKRFVAVFTLRFSVVYKAPPKKKEISKPVIFLRKKLVGVREKMLATGDVRESLIMIIQ